MSNADSSGRKVAGNLFLPIQAMKIPDQLGCRSYWSGGTTSIGEVSTSSSMGATSVGGGTASVGGATTASSGGTTPTNVNRSVMRKSPRVADGSTGFHLG